MNREKHSEHGHERTSLLTFLKLSWFFQFTRASKFHSHNIHIVFLWINISIFSIAVIDCTVSEWGIWSECDVACGTGIMTRTRTILKEPENGGKHCPSLVQKRGCQGTKCHDQRDLRISRGRRTLFFAEFVKLVSNRHIKPLYMKSDITDRYLRHIPLTETAMLLPATLSQSRHVNDSINIRRNLRLRLKEKFQHNRNNEWVQLLFFRWKSRNCNVRFASMERKIL